MALELVIPSSAPAPISLERELEEAGVRTITSLRDGSVTIQLLTDHIASRLNRHVAGRYYVAITELGDLEVRTYEETDYDIRRLGELEPGLAVLETLDAMQRDYADAPGAPIGHLYTHLLRHGYPEQEIEEAIKSLRDVGEIYSPD